MRTSAGAPSDSLRLASWFTREPQPVDADRVLAILKLDESFNDLEVHFWKTPQELHAQLTKLFGVHLDLETLPTSRALTARWGSPKKDGSRLTITTGPRTFQLLCPVRKSAHGVYELNRWIQSRFRARNCRPRGNPGASVSATRKSSGVTRSSYPQREAQRLAW